AEGGAEGGDGWIGNTELSYAPAVQVIAPAPANVSSIELRLRLDPGSVCVDAIAARAEGLISPHTGGSAPAAASHHPPPPADPGDLPLAATNAMSGRRWLLRCGL